MSSDIEAHPAWGDPDLAVYARSKRAFACDARRYVHDGGMLYRHIVASAYTSPMGKGLMSGATAAAVAMVFIRRVLRYVPVTYTGIALFNWVRFAWPPPISRASCERTEQPSASSIRAHGCGGEALPLSRLDEQGRGNRGHRKQGWHVLGYGRQLLAPSGEDISVKSQVEPLLAAPHVATSRTIAAR